MTHFNSSLSTCSNRLLFVMKSLVAYLSLTGPSFWNVRICCFLSLWIEHLLVLDRRGEKRKLKETVLLHHKNKKAAHKPGWKEAEAPCLTMFSCSHAVAPCFIFHANMTSASCSVFCVFITSNMSLVKGTFIVYVVEPFFFFFFLPGGFNWTLLGSLSLAWFSLFVLEAETYPKINPK